MNTEEYYRRLLTAIKDASDWAGAMQPIVGRTYLQEMAQLRREVKRRRRRAKQ